MPDPKRLARNLADHMPSSARSMASRAVRRAKDARTTGREPYLMWRARLAQEIAVAGDTRVAFAGCGAQARNVAGALSESGASVVAGYDARPEAASQLLSAFGGGATPSGSLDELLATRDDWSVLVVATTAESHVSVALTALEAGVDRILVEKPVATGIAEGRRLLDAARSRNASVAVNHTRRWLPSSVGIRRLIEASAIGDVRSINFMWGRNGFAMIGTHLFDFARLLTGSDVAAVQCELDPDTRVTWRGDAFVDQPGFALARMADGTRITIDLSSDLPTQQGFMVIVGETGRIEIDERLGRVRMVGRGRRIWESDYGFSDSLALGSAKAVVDLGRRLTPPCDVADGIAALEATIACQVSNRDGGRWVSLPLDSEVEQEVFPFA